MAKTYDPTRVIVVIGKHIATGFADGTFINVERNSDTYSRVAGASGEQVRNKSADKSGKFTLTLMQTSATNAILSGFAQLADTGAGNDTFPMQVKDANGSTLLSAEIAWVMKPPSNAFGKESGNREWVIECGELFQFTGSTELA